MPPDLVPVDYDPFQGPAQDVFPAFNPGTPPDEVLQPAIGDFPVSQGYKPFNKLFGTGGETRHVLWPEQMVRRGLDVVHSAAEGNNQLESAVGVPGAQEAGSQDVQYTPNALGRALGMTQPWYGPGNESGIAKVQDLSGLMAGGPLIERPGAATLGSGAMRPGEVVLPKAEAPPFYSAVEAAVRDAPQGSMSPEQWRGYLTNRPGVKKEELDWTGLPEGQKVSKQEMLDHVKEHGVEVKEVEKKGETENDTGVPEYARQEAIDHANDSAQEEFYEKHPKKDHEDFLEWLDSPEGQRVRDRHYEDHLADMDFEPVGDEGEPKFSEYQLPGGENYREKLFTLPQSKQGKVFQLREGHNSNYPWEVIDTRTGKVAQNGNAAFTTRAYAEDWVRQAGDDAGPGTGGQYQSSHWDEPNVLAHARMNDRDVPGVGKTLHLEELQSDWHQAGRKGGYKGEGLTPEDHAIRDRIKNNKATTEDYQAWENGVGDKFAKDANGDHVPDAPFKTTWPDLVLKRMIREAAENGYDAVSWTPGEAQAARYDLSKQLDAVKAGKNPDGTYNLGAQRKGGNGFRDSLGERVPENKLADYVGKDLAEKIVRDGGGEYSGLDLKVGGEGMKGFYDKILVDKANALAKKFGGKVEYKSLPGENTRVNAEPTWKVGEPVKFGGGKMDPEKWVGVYNQAGQHVTNIEKSKFDPKKDLGGSFEVIGDSGKSYGKFSTEQEARAHQAQGEKVPVLRLTPQMRDTALRRGFPLFASGVPFPLEPVDHDPFKENK